MKVTGKKQDLLTPTDPIQGLSPEEQEESRAYRQKIHPTLLESFRLSFDSGVDAPNVTRFFFDRFKKSGKMVDPEEANFLYPTEVPWTEPVDEGLANDASLLYEEQQARAFALHNAQSWGHLAAQFTGGLIGGMVGDPVGLAASIAIGGGAGLAARRLQGGIAGARAAAIARQTATFMQAARTSPWRAAVVAGASEGAESLIFSPAVSRSAQQLGQTYTNMDIVQDVGLGILAGGVLGGGAVGVRVGIDAGVQNLSARFRKLSPKAGGNIVAEANIEVEQGLRPDIGHKVQARVKDVHTVRPYQQPIEYAEQFNYSGSTLYHGTFGKQGNISLADQALIDFNFGDGVHLSADSNKVFNATAGQIDLTDGQIVTVRLGEVNLLNADLPLDPKLADELAAILGGKMDQVEANRIVSDLEKGSLKSLYDLDLVDTDPELKAAINDMLRSKGYDGLSYSGDGAEGHAHNGAFIFNPDKLEILDRKEAKIEQGPMMDEAGKVVAEVNNEYRARLEAAERAADDLEFEPGIKEKVEELPDLPIEEATLNKADADTIVDLVDEFQTPPEVLGEGPDPYVFEPLDVSQSTKGKIFYHGTKADVDAFSKVNLNRANIGNLYGPGLYITDNPVVAASYAAPSKLGELIPSLGKQEKPKILMGEVGELKLIDLDSPLPQEVFTIFRKAFDSVSEQELREIQNLPGVDVYAKLKRNLIDAKYDDASYAEVLEDLASNLAYQGYSGFKHTGGQMVGGLGDHNVLVLFEQEWTAGGIAGGSYIRDKIKDIHTAREDVVRQILALPPEKAAEMGRALIVCTKRNP